MRAAARRGFALWPMASNERDEVTFKLETLAEVPLQAAFASCGKRGSVFTSRGPKAELGRLLRCWQSYELRSAN